VTLKDVQALASFQGTPGVGYPVGIMKKSLALLAAACLVFAEEPVDQSVNTRIRQEAMEHSQVMHTLHMLTDRYGPRLTGSPNIKEAADWAQKTMKDWGLANVHLETWPFGRGWQNQHAYGLMTAPVATISPSKFSWTPPPRVWCAATRCRCAAAGPHPGPDDGISGENEAKVKRKNRPDGKATVVPVQL
jgi:hypothetical protein